VAAAGVAVELLHGGHQAIQLGRLLIRLDLWGGNVNIKVQ
jgi:hypothetical protein